MIKHFEPRSLSFFKSFSFQKRYKNTNIQKYNIKGISLFSFSEFWNEETSLEEIVQKIYKEQNKEEFIEEDIHLLLKNRLKTLKDWKKIQKEDKYIFPIGLRIILDELSKLIDKNDYILEELYNCNIGIIDLTPSEKLWKPEKGFVWNIL